MSTNFSVSSIGNPERQVNYYSPNYAEDLLKKLDE